MTYTRNRGVFSVSKLVNVLVWISQVWAWTLQRALNVSLLPIQSDRDALCPKAKSQNCRYAEVSASFHVFPLFGQREIFQHLWLKMLPELTEQGQIKVNIEWQEHKPTGFQQFSRPESDHKRINTCPHWRSFTWKPALPWYPPPSSNVN